MCYLFSVPLWCTPIKVRHSCARKWNNFFSHAPGQCFEEGSVGTVAYN